MTVRLERQRLARQAISVDPGLRFVEPRFPDVPIPGHKAAQRRWFTTWGQFAGMEKDNRRSVGHDLYKFGGLAVPR